jgi:hypothetical protein
MRMAFLGPVSLIVIKSWLIWSTVISPRRPLDLLPWSTPSDELFSKSTEADSTWYIEDHENPAMRALNAKIVSPLSG